MRKLYRSITAHLTKIIGTIGAGIMSLGAWIDPQAIGSAASTYLGANAYRKIGVFLFILVIFRGWYVGRKYAPKAEK
jgi:hypothetical protein